MMRLLATTAALFHLGNYYCEAQPSPCPDVPATGCSVCGDGMCVTADDEIFSFPGQQEAPCGLLQQAGYDGLVPLEFCPILPTLAELGVCACMSSVPAAPTDAPVPTDAPIEPPTDDVGPTPCPDVPATGCSVCGDGMCVTADDEIFSFPGQQEAPCGQLQQAGYDGLVPLDLCPILSTLPELGVCACMSSVPAAPTDAPVPTDAPIEPPTEPPAAAPTDPPAAAPTDPPAAAPTDPPAAAPTDPPVEPPTNPPVEPPTNTPVEPPTVMPVETAPVVFTPMPVDFGGGDDDDDQGKGKGKGKKGGKKGNSNDGGDDDDDDGSFLAFVDSNWN